MFTQILIASNIVIFSIFNVLLGKDSCGEPWSIMCVNDDFLYTFAQVNHLVVSGENVYQLFTSIFVHAFFLHLLWNMLSLWYLGRQLEKYSGSALFLTIFLSSGIVANIASLSLGPATIAGASGAVFGLVGAYVTKVRNIRGIIPAVMFAILIHTPLLLGAKVNVLGHVAGFVVGIAIMLMRSTDATKLSFTANYRNNHNNNRNPNNEIWQAAGKES